MISNYYFATFLSMVFFALTQFAVSVEHPKIRIPVTTASLEDTHQLIGPLGKPIGEVFVADLTVTSQNIKGYFEDYVTVTAIDRKPLQKPIEIPARLWGWSDIEKLVKDHHYQVKVYQDFGTVGYPEAAQSETEIPLQASSHMFVCWLVIVKTIPKSK